MKIKRRSISVALALTLTIALGVFFVFADNLGDIDNTKVPIEITKTKNLDLVIGKTTTFELESDVFTNTAIASVPDDLNAVKILAEENTRDKTSAFYEYFNPVFTFNTTSNKVILNITPTTELLTDNISSFNYDVAVEITDVSQYIEFSGSVNRPITGFQSNISNKGNVSLSDTSTSGTFNVQTDWFSVADSDQNAAQLLANSGVSGADFTAQGANGIYSFSLSGNTVTVTMNTPPTATETFDIVMTVPGVTGSKQIATVTTTITPTVTKILKDSYTKQTLNQTVNPGGSFNISLDAGMFESGSISTSGLKIEFGNSGPFTAMFNGNNVVVSAGSATQNTTYSGVQVYLENTGDSTDRLLIAEGAIHVAPTSGIVDFSGQHIGNASSTTPYAFTKGSSRDLTIKTELFNYNGINPSSVSKSMLDASYLTSVSIDNSNFTAEIVEISGVAYIRITPTSSAPTGSFTGLKVTLARPSGVQYKPGTSHEIIQLTNYTISDSVGATKINGIDSNANLGKTVNGIFGGIAIEDDTSIDESGNNFSGPDLAIGDEVRIYFDSNTFTWTGDSKPNPAIPLTQSLINNASSSVRASATLRVGNRSTSSTSVSPSFKYTNGYSYISVIIPATSLTSTTSSSYELTVHLTYGSSSSNRLTLTLKGDLYNKVILVNDYDTFIDASNGEIIEAEENVNNIEIYAGNGVTLYVNRLVRGKLYQAYTHTDADRDDEKIMDQYSSINEVIHLVTSGGLNTSGTTVWIDVPSSYHVYNKNMEYLGTGSDLRKLPYSTVYYISTSKLNLEDDSSSSNTSSSGVAGANNGNNVVETPNGATPGGTTASNNGNYNPGTGR